MNILSLCKIKYNCEDTTEELYSKLLVHDEKIVNWVEINEIKVTIFEMFHYNNDNLDEKKWIEDRTVYESKMYLSENGMKRSTCSNIWYCPQNCDEIVQSIEREFHYSCIILNKVAKFSKFSFAFYKEETAEDFDLLIFDNCECFYKSVVPKLLKFDKKLIEFLKGDD